MKSNLFILTALSVVLFIFFMISSSIRPYGFFIDEVYFIACSKRLAWGYIDQPPLSLALLSVVVKLFGHNIFAIRVLPALSMAATVFMTGILAKRLGAGQSGMLLAALATATMSVFLIFGSFYSMNAYEPLILVSVVYFMVKMVQNDDPRYWLHVGILSGIGLEMKHTFVLYGLALVLGVLISEKRKLLFNRWLLWGGLACFIILLPNLIWQYVHDFQSLELYRNSFSSKNIEKGYFQIFFEQIIIVNPATFLLWFPGLLTLFLPKGKPYRFMAFAYLFLLLVMFAGHSSRPDRMASIYPFFLAAGALALELYLKLKWQRALQVFLAVVILTGGAIMAPVFCPIMPPEPLKAHIKRIGIQLEIEEGKRVEKPLQISSLCRCKLTTPVPMEKSVCAGSS
jgi:4-amino-4-deoxy-L-arabinose transferase-like glycosyltransferase